MAHIRFLFRGFGNRAELHRFRVVFTGNEPAYSRQLLPVKGQGKHTGDVRLVGLAQDLFDDPFAQLFALIVDQVARCFFGYFVFDREEEPVFFQVVSEDGKTGTLVNAIHATGAFIEIDGRYGTGRRLGDGPVGTGKRTGVAGEAEKAVDQYKAFFVHPFWSRAVRVFYHPDRVLLRVDVLFRKGEILVVIEASPHFLEYIEGCLASAEHGACSFTDPDGIAGTEAAPPEDLVTFDEQLVVLDKPGADVDGIDPFNHFFSAGDGLEVFTFGHHRTGDSVVMFVGNGLQEDMGGEHGNSEPPDPVGLDRETAFVRHGLENGLHPGTCLHELIGGEIPDIPGPDGEHILSKQREFLVHHLLHNGGGEDTGKVVVFEGRHEGYGPGGHDQVFSIDVIDLFRADVFDGNASALEDIPYRRVEEDPFLALAGQRFGNVEPAHAAEFLLLLEEKELVGLHQELAADTVVIVDHDIGHLVAVQLFPGGQSGRTGANDSHGGTVNFYCGVPVNGHPVRCMIMGDFFHFLHPVDAGYADPLHLAVDQHFAGTAFTDPAFEAALAVTEAVTVHRIAGLVEGSGDGEPKVACNFLSFK